MKNFLLIVTIAVLNISCTKNDKTIREQIQQAAQTQNLIAPQPADFTKLLPVLSPNFLQQTAKSHTDPILYQKNLGKTYYYNSDGKLSDKPQVHGFYRQVMGMTNNGLTVAQDFYQDSEQPQTTVFTIKRGGDESNFETQQVNGRMLWFLPDGSLDKMIEVNNGVPMGYTTLFNDQSILATIGVGKNEYFFYHPHSQNLLAYVDGTKDATLTDVVLFRADGSVIVKGKRDQQGEWHEVVAWDSHGKPTKAKKVAAEADNLFHQAQADMKQVLQYANVQKTASATS